MSRLRRFGQRRLRLQIFVAILGLCIICLLILRLLVHISRSCRRCRQLGRCLGSDSSLVGLAAFGLAAGGGSFLRLVIA